MILQELLKLQESKLDDIDQVPFFMDALRTATKPKDSVLSNVKLLMDDIKFTVLYKNKDDSKGISEKVKTVLKGVAECSAMDVKSGGEYFAVRFDLELDGIPPEELEELESKIKQKYPQAKVS